VAGGSFFSGFSADEAQSELLLQEESPVVQMDIGGSASEPLLLLSSRLRCLILDLSLGQDSAAVQVGRKVRDGKLGACFARALGGAAAAEPGSAAGSAAVYAARPGRRLWVAHGGTGAVLSTLRLSCPASPTPLLNSCNSTAAPPAESGRIPGPSPGGGKEGGGASPPSPSSSQTPLSLCTLSKLALFTFLPPATGRVLPQLLSWGDEWGAISLVDMEAMRIDQWHADLGEVRDLSVCGRAASSFFVVHGPSGTVGFVQAVVVARVVSSLASFDLAQAVRFALRYSLREVAALKLLQAQCMRASDGRGGGVGQGLLATLDEQIEVAVAEAAAGVVAEDVTIIAAADDDDEEDEEEEKEEENDDVAGAQKRVVENDQALARDAAPTGGRVPAGCPKQGVWKAAARSASNDAPETPRAVGAQLPMDAIAFVSPELGKDLDGTQYDMRAAVSSPRQDRGQVQLPQLPSSPPPSQFKFRRSAKGQSSMRRKPRNARIAALAALDDEEVGTRDRTMSAPSADAYADIDSATVLPVAPSVSTPRRRAASQDGLLSRIRVPPQPPARAGGGGSDDDDDNTPNLQATEHRWVCSRCATYNPQSVVNCINCDLKFFSARSPMITRTVAAWARTPPQALADATVGSKLAMLPHMAEPRIPEPVGEVDEGATLAAIAQSVAWRISSRRLQEADAAIDTARSNNGERSDALLPLPSTTQEYFQRDFENKIIVWKRGHPGRTFEEYLRDQFPENIRFATDGSVEWLDPRVTGDRWLGTFLRLKSTDTTVELGPLPGLGNDAEALEGSAVSSSPCVSPAHSSMSPVAALPSSPLSTTDHCGAPIAKLVRTPSIDMNALQVKLRALRAAEWDLGQFRAMSKELQAAVKLHSSNHTATLLMPLLNAWAACMAAHAGSVRATKATSAMRDLAVSLSTRACVLWAECLAFSCAELDCAVQFAAAHVDLVHADEVIVACCKWRCAPILDAIITDVDSDRTLASLAADLEAGQEEQEAATEQYHSGESEEVDEEEGGGGAPGAALRRRDAAVSLVLRETAARDRSSLRMLLGFLPKILRAIRRVPELARVCASRFPDLRPWGVQRALLAGVADRSRGGSGSGCGDHGEALDFLEGYLGDICQKHPGVRAKHEIALLRLAVRLQLGSPLAGGSDPSAGDGVLHQQAWWRGDFAILHKLHALSDCWWGRVLEDDFRAQVQCADASAAADDNAFSFCTALRDWAWPHQQWLSEAPPHCMSSCRCFAPLVRMVCLAHGNSGALMSAYLCEVGTGAGGGLDDPLPHQTRLLAAIALGCCAGDSVGVRHALVRLQHHGGQRSVVEGVQRAMALFDGGNWKVAVSADVSAAAARGQQPRSLAKLQFVALLLDAVGVPAALSVLRECECDVRECVGVGTGATMLEKHELQLQEERALRQLLVRADSHLWMQQGHTLPQQLVALRQHECAALPTPRLSEAPATTATCAQTSRAVPEAAVMPAVAAAAVAPAMPIFDGFVEDPAAAWGRQVSCDASRVCAVCNLPVFMLSADGVTTVPIVTFRCQHAFHRECVPQMACLECFAHNFSIQSSCLSRELKMS
jgi:hypothetical protein